MRIADAVIRRPDRVPKGHRGVFAVLTLAMWSLYAWLLLPLLTFLLWLAGLTTAYSTTLREAGSVDVVLVLGLVVASVFMAVLLLVWAEVQRHRFTGVERRRRAPDTPVPEVASALGVDAATLHGLRSGRVVLLTMREDGTPAAAVVVPLTGEPTTDAPVRVPRPRRDGRPDPAEPPDPDGEDAGRPLDRVADWELPEKVARTSTQTADPPVR